MGFKDRDDPLMTLRREVERLVEEVGKGVFGGASAARKERPTAAASAGSSAPPVDLIEEEDALELRADLPGWSQEEVTVEAEPRTVMLRGTATDGTDKPDAGRSHLKERKHPSFMRRVVLPVEVDTAQAAARFERGVLILRLPKAQGARRQRIEIEGE